jgi:hypothetical protein
MKICVTLFSVDEKLMDERCGTLFSNKQKLVTLLLMDE